MSISVQLRYRVLERLGKACVFCGYNEDVRALEIDHIKGGWSSQQKKGKVQQVPEYKKILLMTDKEMRSYVRCLCANCHRIRTAKQLRGAEEGT